MYQQDSRIHLYSILSSSCCNLLQMLRSDASRMAICSCFHSSYQPKYSIWWLGLPGVSLLALFWRCFWLFHPSHWSVWRSFQYCSTRCSVCSCIFWKYHQTYSSLQIEVQLWHRNRLALPLLSQQPKTSTLYFHLASCFVWVWHRICYRIHCQDRCRACLLWSLYLTSESHRYSL